MLVYHGSTEKIQWPDVQHSQKYLAQDLVENEPELFEKGAADACTEKNKI